MNKPVDICLVLEGTYPYVMGGVSSWTHELIKMNPDYTFALVCLLPPGKSTPQAVYQLPSNVHSQTDIHLQELPNRQPLSGRNKKSFFQSLGKLLPQLVSEQPHLHFPELLQLFDQYHDLCGQDTLLNNPAIWDIITSMYWQNFSSESFLDYFWSWRTLFGSLFSVLTAPIPDAKCYHSLCTGYAGIYTARASITTQKPALLTEHGIYTNERRIEIAAASWIQSSEETLNVDSQKKFRELHEFWSDMFTAYSKICYNYAHTIVSLFEANRLLQIEEGAAPQKCTIIPNGVDLLQFNFKINQPSHAPVIALIGRVVPIKDIKTFIRAIKQVSLQKPDIKAWVLGPFDEDPEYYEECQHLVQQEGLTHLFTFTGRVNIHDFLDQIDLIVLSSISEAQPLVILEAGASGTPVVATHVGSCHELIYGNSSDSSNKPGGIVTELANPGALAGAMIELLNDPQFYEACAQALHERVARAYNKDQQQQAYHQLYQTLIEFSGEKPWQA